MFGYETHGDIYTAPHVNVSGISSGTEIRRLLGSPKVKEESRKIIFKKTFGYPGKADFVFEDSTHTGEYLEFALPFWWKHLKSGGILAGHDYDNEVKTAVDLFQTLNDMGGLGLSANQIGEDKSVCVVNVTNPFFLQNPKIVKKEKEIIYKEGCLSIPDKMVKTKRYEKILVKADNIEDEMYFGPQKEKKFDFKTNSYTANELLILEAVCVQTEIDQLNGHTIYDREHKLKKYKRIERKYVKNKNKDVEKMGADALRETAQDIAQQVKTQVKYNGSVVAQLKKQVYELIAIRLAMQQQPKKQEEQKGNIGLVVDMESVFGEGAEVDKQAFAEKYMRGGRINEEKLKEDMKKPEDLENIVVQGKDGKDGMTMPKPEQKKAFQDVQTLSAGQQSEGAISRGESSYTRKTFNLPMALNGSVEMGWRQRYAQEIDENNEEFKKPQSIFKYRKKSTKKGRRNLLN